MIGSFTSGQAEWLCKQRPVGAANLKCQTFVFSNSEEKHKHKESALPEANVEDWPEVQNAKWRGRSLRCRAGKTGEGGSWCWVQKPIGAVSSVPEDAELLEDEEVPNTSLPEETAAPSYSECNRGEHAQDTQSSDDWPSLQEAYEGFENCEIASVASSWMDVDVGALYEESDMLVVAPAPQLDKKAPSRTWATLAKQNVSDPAAGRAAGCIKPPFKAIVRPQEPQTAAFGRAETARVMHATCLSHRQSEKLLRKHNGSSEAAINAYLEEQPDRADACLTELEERRMLGRGPKPGKKK